MADVPANLVARLEAAAQRYEQLTAEMNDPAVASDPNRIVAAATEHARLGRIVEPYRQYLELEGQIQDAEAIVQDAKAEDELKALARAELEELNARREALMARITEALALKWPSVTLSSDVYAF